MPLSPGARLGPYEILAPLGAGGMGEVYRARDERLKRDVAIKVLPASYSKDADRLRRFEQEAQAAGGLNHPNITAVYDIGTHEGAPYVVQELLEGETLRSAMAGGRLAPRRAIDYSIQVARGLAAAHERGIVHRDLKPENLFVTRDGRVKILDFGLAKLKHAEEGAGQGTNLPTATAGTEPGVVLGTLGYMSPEQAKGKPADARSDIFSFGAILYEMLSGRRAFHGDSAAETMSAILREEPPDLSVTNQSVSLGLERIVRHAIEKNPEQRFHSAHDVAFDLENLSGESASKIELARRPPGRTRWVAPLLAVMTIVVAAGLGYLAGARRSDARLPSFQQLTFRRGSLWSARFAPGGKTILYGASWDGNETEMYVASPDSPESRPFGIPRADLLAVSPSGDVAVAVRSRLLDDFRRTGTLAQTNATGGAAPREILEDVEYADWIANSNSLAAVRTVEGRNRLEFPIGKTVYETSGWIGNPRVSARGDRVAFIDHPSMRDDGGSVAVVDRSGRKMTLSSLYASALGLAWSPDGSEIWFTAAEAANRSLHAVSLAGKHRLLRRGNGSLTLHDVSPDGRVLLADDLRRMRLIVQPPGEKRERDLSWLDWSYLKGFSSDGKTVLFFESGEAGGPQYTVYVRGTDGSPAVRLGDGNAVSLSPDGRWALALAHKHTEGQLVLYPTGAGQTRVLSLPSLRALDAQFLPDGHGLLVAASQGGRDPRIFLTNVEGGPPRPVTPEGHWRFRAVSPDGRCFVVRAPDETKVVYSLGGNGPTPVTGLNRGDQVLGFARDSQRLYIQRAGALAAQIETLDPATGRAEPWKQILPEDTAGFLLISEVRLSPDGDFYGYSYTRLLSTLYLVEGLK